jgi:hypothetical protein
MNIDRALEVLERELAISEENQGQERPEETSADQATLEKYTQLWRRACGPTWGKPNSRVTSVFRFCLSIDPTIGRHRVDHVLVM